MLRAFKNEAPLADGDDDGDKTIRLAMMMG